MIRGARALANSARTRAGAVAMTAKSAPTAAAVRGMSSIGSTLSVGMESVEPTTTISGNYTIPSAPVAINSALHREMHAAAVSGNLQEVAKSMWTENAIKNSLQGSLEVIASNNPHFVFIEAFVPTSSAGGEFVAQHSSLQGDMNEKFGQIASESQGRTVKSGSSCSLDKAFQSKQPVAIASLTSADVYPGFADAKAPFIASVSVPVVSHDHVHAIIRVYTATPIDFDVAELTYSINGIVAAGIYGVTPANALLPFRQYHKEVRPEMISEVFQLVAQNGVFSPQRAWVEVDWFFRIGLAPVYFNRFGSHIVANHILVYIASKQFQVAARKPQELWLAIENNVQLMGGLQPEQSLHMVSKDIRKIVAVERNIIRRIKLIPNNKAFSLEMSTSALPFAPYAKDPLALYILQTHDFANQAIFDKKREDREATTNILDIASTAFLKEKTTLVRDRYQELITEACNNIGPVAKVYPTYRDGTIPLMFAFRFNGNDSNTTSYMTHFTQLLHRHNLRTVRRFIETFANGIIVFSLYIQGDSPKAEIAKFMKQFSLLHLGPQNEILTPKFLDGTLSPEEYAYLNSATRLLLYVANERNESYKALANQLKEKGIDNTHLRQLYTTMAREAVSISKIQRTMLAYPSIVKAIYKDFETRVQSDTVQPPNADLIKRINTQVKFALDSHILRSLLNFNRNVLKTNFFRMDKVAISYRLDPNFFSELDLQQLPYGVFFISGAEFQGLHVRFASVSRGGIRRIRSADEFTYMKNVSSQFHENYELAYTQNLKNKDIPEYGSKGTILLNLDCQDQVEPAFRKYIDSMLDLMLLEKDASSPNYIHDRYGKEELVFCGPDEGTAGYMEWAALHSKKRGYPFWRSFTTGKPQSLGGIPHDTFGMTTTSVHRVATACLERMGLDETQVTKIQTGGPDGDLGSNEILVSKDKTIAIIDGDGVAYDPNGLNREELVRLAKARKTIRSFDRSRLGVGGFIVLTEDTDVTLPNGEQVPSGVAFRDEFHLHPLAAADLFVPCGGRPGGINSSNVHRVIDENGKPRWKVLVEGANLFVTQDARLTLEKAGIVLYKDASANKGGVTSSSLEVLAALALEDDVFAKNMTVQNHVVPDVYKKYVHEIKDRIANDAYLEFDAIWREHIRSKLPRFQLTDRLSLKINVLTSFINTSSLWDNKALRRVVLLEAIPKTLQDLVGLDAILTHTPESYIRAIFCAYLASRYVYKYGSDANEFAFYEFMEHYTKQAAAIEFGLKK